MIIKLMCHYTLVNLISAMINLIYAIINLICTIINLTCCPTFSISSGTDTCMIVHFVHVCSYHNTPVQCTQKFPQFAKNGNKSKFEIPVLLHSKSVLSGWSTLGSSDEWISSQLSFLIIWEKTVACRSI